MKLFLYLSLILFINNISHAKLGRHNIQINIGGGYEVNQVNNILNKSELNYTLGGGMFSVELGYLLHSVQKNSLIHGFDLRTTFTMGFLSASPSSTLFRETLFTQGMFAMTYTLGKQLSNSRLMFDTIGFGGFFSRIDTRYTQKDTQNIDISTDHFGIQIILPGVQYILNNGFTIGLRNKLEIHIGHFGPAQILGIFGFDTTVSFGYTFGKGE